MCFKKNSVFKPRKNIMTSHSQLKNTPDTISCIRPDTGYPQDILKDGNIQLEIRSDGYPVHPRIFGLFCTVNAHEKPIESCKFLRKNLYKFAYDTKNPSRGPQAF